MAKKTFIEQLRAKLQAAHPAAPDRGHVEDLLRWLASAPAWFTGADETASDAGEGAA